MNAGNAGNGGRLNMGGGVVLYGGSPPFDPYVPTPDVAPPFQPFTPNPLGSLTFPVLTVCAKCNNHFRQGEPCPFCIRAELDALKTALGDKAKPAEAIETLRAALRKALGALRDISRVTGGSLEPLIADCEKALDT